MLQKLNQKFVFNLDWNLLRTFLVVAQEKSITRAAHRLRRGQPAVSLALKRLETSLGCQLIDRGHGVFRLTAAGRRLAGECADLFDGIARLPDAMDSSARHISGTITIVLASHVTTPILDEQLRKMAELHPGVRFVIRIETSAQVVQSVRDKHASFGICLVDRQFPDLDYVQMYREFFGFFCGPTHPLFGQEELTMEDLKPYSSVAFDTDNLNDALRPVALFRNQWGLDHDIVGHSSHLEEVRRMIQCGLGIGPLPVHVVRRDVADGLLWRLPPYDAPPAVDIFLVQNPDKRLNRAEDVFIKSLRAEIGATPPEQRTYDFHG